MYTWPIWFSQDGYREWPRTEAAPPWGPRPASAATSQGPYRAEPRTRSEYGSL